MLFLRQAVCAPRKCRISYGCAGVLTSLLDISDGVGVIAKIESINALSDALRHNGHKGFAQCSDGSGFRTLWVGSWVLPNCFLNTQLTSTAPNNHGAFSVQKILGFWSFFSGCPQQNCTTFSQVLALFLSHSQVSPHEATFLNWVGC